MDEFKAALRAVNTACSELSEAWEKLDEDFSTMLVEKYPFNKDFREIVSELAEWRESLPTAK